jgi:hypothetical protein
LKELKDILKNKYMTQNEIQFGWLVLISMLVLTTWFIFDDKRAHINDKVGGWAVCNIMTSCVLGILTNEYIGFTAGLFCTVLWLISMKNAPDGD